MLRHFGGRHSKDPPISIDFKLDRLGVFLAKPCKAKSKPGRRLFSRQRLPRFQIAVAELTRRGKERLQI